MLEKALLLKTTFNVIFHVLLDISYGREHRVCKKKPTIRLLSDNDLSSGVS